MDFEKTFIEKVNKLRCALNVEKKRYNNGLNFYYRNAEDIMNGVKPLLEQCGLILTIDEDLVLIRDDIFIKAKAALCDADGHHIETNAFAMIGSSTGKNSPPQVTGSASSYARKYALNGLLFLDDAKDPDSEEQPKLPTLDRFQTRTQAKPATQTKPAIKMYRQQVIDYCKKNNISLKEVKEDYGIDDTTTEDGFMKIYEDLTGMPYEFIGGFTNDKL